MHACLAHLNRALHNCLLLSCAPEQYRQRRDELDGMNADVAVKAGEAQRLMRYMVQVGRVLRVRFSARGCKLQLCSPWPACPPTCPPECMNLSPAPQSTLGRARTSMVQWLLECLAPACASTTRAKAVKALGEVVQADTRVLDSSAVQMAVDRALQVGPGGCSGQSLVSHALS